MQACANNNPTLVPKILESAIDLQHTNKCINLNLIEKLNELYSLVSQNRHANLKNQTRKGHQHTDQDLHSPKGLVYTLPHLSKAT